MFRTKSFNRCKKTRRCIWCQVFVVTAVKMTGKYIWTADSEKRGCRTVKARRCQPGSRLLSGTESNSQLAVTADEAVPLTRNILRPFPFRKLPQRPSRARRGGGITAYVWRSQTKRTQVSVSLPTLINVVCCTLHNLVLNTDSHARLIGHLQEQGKQGGSSSLNRNIGRSSSRQWEGGGGERRKFVINLLKDSSHQWATFLFRMACCIKLYLHNLVNCWVLFYTRS